MKRRRKHDLMAEAAILANFTPWNPDPYSIKRVGHPFPVPTECPHCGRPVAIVNNSVIFREPKGPWPWIYKCTNPLHKRGGVPVCGAYVSMHPGTAIPMGTLADAITRRARKAAKEALDQFWSPDLRDRKMTRASAYARLAFCLGIPLEKCHVGLFDVAMCERVIKACER